MELRAIPIEQAIKVHNIVGEHVHVVDYQPGDGTRYELVFASVGPRVSGAENAVLVSLINFPQGPSMLVERNHGFLAPSYVTEKLGIKGASAVTLAEIIAHFTGREAYSPEEYRAL